MFLGIVFGALSVNEVLTGQVVTHHSTRLRSHPTIMSAKRSVAVSIWGHCRPKSSSKPICSELFRQMVIVAKVHKGLNALLKAILTPGPVKWIRTEWPLSYAACAILHA